MNKIFHYWILILLLFFSHPSIAQGDKAHQPDLTIRSSRILHIQGKQYVVVLLDRGCFILNSKKDTIQRQDGDYFAMKCDDFNNDGNLDIFLDKGGNTPETYDLLLYDPKNKRFKKVEDFDLFPSPTRIPGTKIYYSYHRNGCADMDWMSDLFYVDHFRTIHLGKIHGEGCQGEGSNIINIYRVRDSRKTLIKTLPLSVVDKYKDNKWGFIRRYWSEEYKQFL